MRRSRKRASRRKRQSHWSTCIESRRDWTTSPNTLQAQENDRQRYDGRNHQFGTSQETDFESLSLFAWWVNRESS